METRKANDPGNPLIAIILIPAALLFADIYLGDGQYAAMALEWYKMAQASGATANNVSAVTGGGLLGIPPGTQCLLAIVIFACVGIYATKSMGGQSVKNATTQAKTEKKADENKQKPTGVGVMQRRRPYIASDIRKGGSK